MLADGHFRLVSASVFPSSQYSSLDEIVSQVRRYHERMHPDAACFGVAGPVRNGRVETTNLPWIIESKRLADELHLNKALLINDLEASAWGIACARRRRTWSRSTRSRDTGRQPGSRRRRNRAGRSRHVLGRTKHHVFASEGGHTDFAPRSELEIELFNYLHVRFGHVSYERMLSGPGLVNIFRFPARHRTRRASAVADR